MCQKNPRINEQGKTPYALVAIMYCDELIFTFHNYTPDASRSACSYLIKYVNIKVVFFLIIYVDFVKCNTEIQVIITK